MKKPIHRKQIGKAKNAIFILFLLFLLTLPAMDHDLFTPLTKDQEECQVIQAENELPIEERVNYSPLHRLSPIGKAMAVQSGSGSSFAVQETFNGYNSSVLGNTTNSFNNPSNRTSSLNITNPTTPNYSKHNGTITVANITAENEWQEIEPDATSPMITLGGATSNPNTTAMEFNIT
ncbi:MAG: hypothetical protein ACE5R6_21260, partial [Candidatus Heimdallarchaeota archaeon]